MIKIPERHFKSPVIYFFQLLLKQRLRHESKMDHVGFVHKFRKMVTTIRMLDPSCCHSRLEKGVFSKSLNG